MGRVGRRATTRFMERTPEADSMSAVRDVLAGLRDPEYTGANRCLPCTVVNLFLAFAVALAVELAVVGSGTGGPAPFAGEALFVGAAFAVYLRGYLVPGTPALTERYLPQWLLSALGKDEPAEGLTGESRVQSGGDVEPERILRDADVLTGGADGDDVRVAGEFERALWNRLDVVDDERAQRELLLDVLDEPGDNVRLGGHGDVFRASRDGTRVGTWASASAFRVDVAAGALLDDRMTDWADLSVGERGRVLRTLRSVLPTCPDCRADPSLAADTVETCCATYEVRRCPDCGTRLHEAEVVA